MFLLGGAFLVVVTDHCIITHLGHVYTGEWIEAAGYDVKVTGGGRIDYSPNEGRCVVYGFSYGFGKGDHELAAQIVREFSGGSIQATVDNSVGLY